MPKSKSRKSTNKPKLSIKLNNGNVNRNKSLSGSNKQQKEKAGKFFDEVAVYRIVYFSPFVGGCFLASDGLVLPSLTAFSLILAFFAAAFYTGKGSWSVKKESFSFTNPRFVFCYAMLIILAFSIFGVVKDWILVLQCTLVAGSIILRQQMVIKSPFGLVTSLLAQIVEMSAFVVIGVYSQIKAFHFQTALLGFVPGCFLASYLVLKNIDILEKSGWERRKEFCSSSNKTMVRPRGISRLYAISLMTGPALITILSTLNIVPQGFIWTGLTLIPTPGLASGVMNKSTKTEILAKKTLCLAALSSVLVFMLA